MPPKRRTAKPRSTAAAQQRQLSFHGKTNKITKPRNDDPPEAINKKTAALEEAADELVAAEIEEKVKQPTTAEKAIEEQAKSEARTLKAAPDPLTRPDQDNKVSDVLGGQAKQDETGATGGKGAGWVGDEETQARKISDTRIKKYWREKEQERIAPRVHQEELTVEEKILREWDMSGQFGPCIGIARLKRWKRANLLGLHPPIEVLAVLLKQMDQGEVKSQRAHVDELMSSRFIET